ncbi:LytR family transcriptional regulator [Erysipelothrix sp. HDW6B]|uniref:LCP family protein n=1 Tax=Erysipelothrix sp. HDW6B TaxID=2714929 RepID=UPI001408E029|nr:LCP family protein [Erysipelothrix sp. HDW6B]QIK86963.1 LytR family transcriptional regulator [Erysipelothrix sp. HDW6B]
MDNQQTPTTKPKFSLWDNVYVGMGVALISNGLVIALLFIVGNYMKIHAEYFTWAIGILVILALLLNITFLVGYAKNKRVFRIVTVVFGLLLITVGSVATYYLYRTDFLINQIVNTTGQENVEHVVVSIDGTLTENDLDGKRVGFVTSTNPEFAPLMQDTIHRYSRTVEFVEYPSNKELVQAAIDKEIPFAVLPKNYTRVAETVDAPVNPFEKSKAIIQFSTSITSDISSVDVIKEPFTMLMLGNNDNLSDSIILATFNPQTMKATMTSIPRDSYVPIACYPGQSSDKINHARGISRECMIDTVENFLDIQVDFYFETDFYALVKIVDALGGLEIESPHQFAGSFPIEGSNPVEYDDITVPAGLNHLDGKQVVTFARERHTFPDGDFARQRNQQYVIQEVAKKIINTRNPNTLVSVLDGAKDNISTNMSVSDMTGLMGYAIQSIQSSPLEPMDTFRITQSQVLGVPDFVGDASVVRPYSTYVNNTRTLIDQNMEKEPRLQNDTSFGFTLLKPYDAFTQNPDLEPFDGLFWSPNGPTRLPVSEREETTEQEQTREPQTNNQNESQQNTQTERPTDNEEEAVEETKPPITKPTEPETKPDTDNENQKPDDNSGTNSTKPDSGSSGQAQKPTNS